MIGEVQDSFRAQNRGILSRRLREEFLEELSSKLRLDWQIMVHQMREEKEKNMPRRGNSTHEGLEVDKSMID